MADLLSRDVDPTGIMSLLTPFVTGGAIAPPAPGAAPDPQAQAMAGAAAMPAWLAFARVMGQAAMPHYGPPTPIGPALADAMSGAYSTAVQAEQLPLLRQSLAMSLAQREQALQQQNLALQQQQFEFGRQQDMWRAFGAPLLQGGAPGAGGGQTPPGQPPQPASGFGPPATTQALAQLPEVQAIADPVMRQRVIATAADQGMSAPAAAQWARQLKVESGGQQFGPDGTIITSPKGALGVGQMMPATFAAVQKTHPDVTGGIDDPGSNLKASGYYFNQGLQLAGGNLAGAAAYYVGGPDGLSGWQSGKPGADVADYVARTGAGGAVGAPSTLGPMVATRLPGLGQVPQTIELQAEAAAAAQLRNNPMAALQAYTDVITKYRSGQQIQTAPGVQTEAATGNVTPAPRPTTTVPMTQAEVEANSALDPRMAYYKTIYADGTLAKPPEAVAPRQAMAQITQETALRDEYLNDPTIKTYNSMLPYYTRMQGIEAATIGPNATREPQLADDYALLHNFAHIQDPTIGTSEGREAGLYEGAGIPGMIKQGWATVMGGGKLTTDQRQWLLDTARAEMGGQEAQAYQVLQEKRRVAAGTGLRPDQVAVPWNLSDAAQTTLAAMPPGSRTPGTPTAPAYSGPTVPHPGVTTPATPTPLPLTPVPALGAAAEAPAAPPAPPAGGAGAPGVGSTRGAPATPPAGAQPPAPAAGSATLPPPGKVTAGLLQSMPLDRLRAAVTRITPDDGYSDRELGLIVAELRRRNPIEKTP